MGTDRLRAALLVGLCNLTPMVLHRRVVLHAIGSFLSGLAFVSPLHPPLARLALKRPCHLVCAVGGAGDGGGAGRHRQDAADGRLVLHGLPRLPGQVRPTGRGAQPLPRLDAGKARKCLLGLVRVCCFANLQSLGGQSALRLAPHFTVVGVLMEQARLLVGVGAFAV